MIDAKQCTKIHSTVVDNGGKIYDMTDKDYEKYVISDAVHIGWKGWVYVDQQIAKHMNDKNNLKLIKTNTNKKNQINN